METYPQVIRRVVEHLKRFPGVGTKSAERIVAYLLKADSAEDFRVLKERVRPCRRCCNIADSDLCPVCAESSRERVLAVVEEVKDVAALEKAGFRGYYHVLGGTIDHLDDVGPESLSVASLLARVEQESFTEVIIATNATAEGETTAHYLAKVLRERGYASSRLGFGLSVGSELEYTDPETLKKSIENRRQL
jgi:recombination protein RecR